MTIHPFTKFEFILSCAKLAQLPADEGSEVAFIGRSNAGKSSALNAIAGQNKLAHTSKTPGRTQLLNVFAKPDDLSHRLVDLPGYGYAKVPDSIKKFWTDILPAYFSRRQSLMGLILIMDIRHPMKPLDEQMLGFLQDRGLPAHVLLTKADKLTRAEQNKQLSDVQKLLEPYHNASLQLFSAPKKLGVDAAREAILSWLIEPDESAL